MPKQEVKPKPKPLTEKQFDEVLKKVLRPLPKEADLKSK